MAILQKRDVWHSLWRGFSKQCPSCGKGNIFGKYLKVNDHCPNCDEALHHHRADDAPPYFTIFIVGHIIVPVMMAIEIAYRPSLWVHTALWLPAIILLSYWLLPRIKGALIGLQWAILMHGFDPNHDETKEFGGHSAS